MSANKPYLGAAYYPEDWPLTQIDEDIRLMKESGMNCMRIGEFAWSRMEPQDGVYDFDWLHTVVDKLYAADIAIIMCTPTCTPPAWLTQAYPETMVLDDMGVRYQHGARRHMCPNHPTYREYCVRITRKMAQEFADQPGIIGWQLDNEIYPAGQRGCCCPVCHQKFLARLQARFDTIDRLNAAWGTDLWSQTYQSFDQIPIPRHDTWHHPSLLTAWMDFQSDSYVEFSDAQADVLHELTPHAVGTDMMPFAGYKYVDVFKKLDVVQFNHYNSMDNLYHVPFWMDYIRPIKPAPFWNTETATCWSGATSAGDYKAPGFCRINSWLPVAMGGEANLYWLWRAHWSGQELMHGSVVSSSGRPMHIIDEVLEIADGFEKASAFLENAPPVKTGLALHYSQDAATLFQFQPIVYGFEYTPSIIERAYHPLIQAGLRPDVIDPCMPLDEYKVIFSPFLASIEYRGLRDRLKDWIEAGGVWIAGPLTDCRTPDTTKYVHAPFGVLEDWGGVYTKYQIVGDRDNFELEYKGQRGKGTVWFDGLVPSDGVESLALYGDGALKGLSAITERKMGKGRVIVLGTMPEPALLQRLMCDLCNEAGVAKAAEQSGNMLVIPRAGGGMAGCVALELENREGKIMLHAPMKDLMTGKMMSGEVKVPPYGLMVLVK